MLDHPDRYADFGASGNHVPIRTKPVVVLTSDLSAYLSDLKPLIDKLWGDTDYMAYADPNYYEDVAFGYVEGAEDADKCHVPNVTTKKIEPYTDPTTGVVKNIETVTRDRDALYAWDGSGCPTFTQKEWDAMGPEGRKAAAKKNLADYSPKEARYLAWAYKERAAKIWEGIQKRKLTTYPIPAELDFRSQVAALRTRWDDDHRRMVSDVTHYASDADFQILQALDLDIQDARDTYTKLTGLKPSGIVPTTQKEVEQHKEKSSWETALEGLITILKWSVVGVVAYYAGTTIVSGIGALKSAKASAPSLPKPPRDEEEPQPAV